MTSKTAIKDIAPRTEEPGAGELFASLWKTRRLVTSSVVVAALALAVLILALRVAIPTEQTFQHAIRFVFPGAIQGVYPNKLNFSTDDLVAPIVLQNVYENNGLKELGIKLKDFAAAVSVSPYSSTYSETVGRFRKRLANRKLTFTERTQIEKEMAETLQQLVRGNALIRLRILSRTGISPELGTKIVHDIPLAWSKVSIENRGVLKLPESIESKELIDLKLFDSLDYPTAIDMLIKSLQLLSNRIRNLSQMGGAETLFDKQDKHTLLSLRRAIQNFETYRLRNLDSAVFGLGLVKRPTATKLLFERRIAILQQKKKALETEVKSISDALSSYSKSNVGNAPRSGTRSSTTSLPQGASSPQIGEGFIDRIIDLSRKSQDESFRKNLVEQQLEIKKNAIKLDSEISTIKLLLSRIPTSSTSINRDNISALNVDRKSVIASFPDMAMQLNKYWKTLARLYGLLSEKRYSYASNLYSNLTVPDKVLSHHAIFNKKILILYLAALAAVAMLAMLGGLVWQAIRHKLKPAKRT